MDVFYLFILPDCYGDTFQYCKNRNSVVDTKFSYLRHKDKTENVSPIRYNTGSELSYMGFIMFVYVPSVCNFDSFVVNTELCF